MEDKLEERVEKSKKPRFDPDLPPSNIHNLETARARGLKYDKRNRVYRDNDGCPTRDKYGQVLG